MVTECESTRNVCCSSGSPCCGSDLINTENQATIPWINAIMDTPVGFVPQVKTELQFNDMLGAWKARWGMGRMNFKVAPGLYAIGNPDSDSPVLVSANYKLSFDRITL